MNEDLTKGKKRSWKDELKLWTGVGFGFIALCVSFASFIVSKQAADMSLENMEHQVLQELRTRFYNVSDDEKVPRKYWESNDLEPPEKNSEDWYRIKRYWQMSFDEWEVLNRRHRGMFAHKWEEDYVPRMAGALERKSLRKVVVDLLETDTAWSNDADYQEFGKELQRIYKEKCGKSLLTGNGQDR